MKKLLIFCSLALVCVSLVGCGKSKELTQIWETANDSLTVFKSLGMNIEDSEEAEVADEMSDLVSSFPGQSGVVSEEESEEIPDETKELLKALEGLTVDDLIESGLIDVTPTPAPTRSPEVEEASRNLQQQMMDLEYLDSCDYRGGLKVGFARFRHTDTKVTEVSLFEDDKRLACTSEFDISCNMTALGEGLLLDTSKYNQSISATLKRVYVDGSPVDPMSLVLVNPSMEPIYFETNNMYNCPKVTLNYLINSEVESVIVEYGCKIQSYDEDLKPKTQDINVRMVLYDKGQVRR